MTDQELLQKLAAALERTASDDLDAILSRCGEQKGSVTKMSEANSNHERKGAGKNGAGGWLRPVWAWSWPEPEAGWRGKTAMRWPPWCPWT